MTRRYAIAPLSIVLLVVGLLGCAHWFAWAADVLVPVEEENRLGEEFEQQLDEELDFHDDPQLVGYVRDRGEEIVDAAAGDVPEGIEVEFHVVDDDEMVNAFAIPGGGVYVFTGLMEAMDNEAEFTAVLAHEVAHVTQRHIARRLVAAYGAELVSRMALGEEPGLVGQLVTAVARQGFLLSYSRTQEREADEFGVHYHVDAGYDPREFISFFEKLQDQPAPPVFLSTHPPPAERIENIRRHIEEISEVPDRTERQRFQRAKDRI